MKKYFILLFLIIIYVFFKADIVLAEIRIKESLEFCSRKKFKNALKKIESYLKDNPEDVLALDMKDIISQAIAADHLKRAFTLISEGLPVKGVEDLDLAARYQSEYTSMIEKKYSKYLKKYRKEKAANMILYDILKSPRPTDNEIYEIGRRVRERSATSIHGARLKKLEELKIRVDELKRKKNWDEAIEYINRYLEEYPSDIKNSSHAGKADSIVSINGYPCVIPFLIIIKPDIFIISPV